MLFRVHRQLQFGTTLYLTGSTSALSKWSENKALPCKWTDHNNWILQVDPLSGAHPPARFEFKFFTRNSAGETVWEPGENHSIVLTHTTPVQHAVANIEWGVGVEIVLPSLATSQPNISPSSAPKDTESVIACTTERNHLDASCVPTDTEKQTIPSSHITVTFRMKYSLQDMEHIYVVGSIPELGGWNKMHSPYMEPVGSSFHELRLQLPSDETHSSFEYKYFTRRKDGTRRWESGDNRLAEPSRYESAVPRDEIVLDDRWEKLRIEFSIYMPGQENDIMHITGDIAEIGAWHKPGPTRMNLGPLQKLETDVHGRKWTLQIWVDSSIKPFSYRYILINSKTSFELWEREPNRRTEFPENQVFRNSVHVCKDVNFVSEMKFDKVPPNMFIGPYPQSASDVDSIVNGGATGVLNVQTDEDFEHRGIQWDVIKQRYDEQGVEVVRYPIRDFDRDALKEKLNGATHALDDMIKQGRDVYIHCTAGMGRAPAVAVAYLCWVKKMKLSEAVAHVKKNRTVAVPNVPVLEQALREAY